MSRKSVTLADVAKSVNVTTMTASRALNGTDAVSAEVRQKVVAAAKDLGYSPNPLAKRLKGGRANLLGLAVGYLQSSAMAEIIGSVNAAVKQAGMELIIYVAGSELGAPKQHEIKRVLGGLCDGIVLLLPMAPDGVLAEFESSSVPVVAVNYWRTETKLPMVRGDNYVGSRSAVEYLIGLGHRRIAFISGSDYTGQSPERQRGYQDALKQAGIKPVKALMSRGDFTRSAGFESTKVLMAQSKPPTAIFAANDNMALGAMDALKELGLRIPEDVSVFGFDDEVAAKHSYPRLSTVRQPLSEIGEQAVQMILRRIGSTSADELAKDTLIELPSSLVVRDSCAPVRALLSS